MSVVVIGGGAGGLLTGMLLANDGHDVTVLERDAAPVPESDEAAWDSWQRTGVSQFRQPHAYQGRSVRILQDELPDVWASFESAGIHRFDWLSAAPEPNARRQPGDRDLVVVGARRATFERRVALVAESTPRLDVRRGIAVTGLLANGSDRDLNRPHVVGVKTDTEEAIRGDLVVDSAGRRTPVPRFLGDLGSGVEQFKELDGFTYFSRWFRRSTPFPRLTRAFVGGLAPGLICLLFPGDAGVFGVAMVGLAKDKMLRGLRDEETYLRLGRRFDVLGEWLEGAEAITDVIPMSSIQNRHLRYWHERAPSAVGLVNIADSAMSTNPSLGRGVSLAGLYGLELRAILRETGNPREIVEAYDRAQQERLTPWLDDAIESDLSFREALGAAIGEPPPDHPPTARQLIVGAGQADIEIWRTWSRVANVFDLPSTATSDAELVDRARSIAPDVPPVAPDLDRATLEDVLSGTS